MRLLLIDLNEKESRKPRRIFCSLSSIAVGCRSNLNELLRHANYEGNQKRTFKMASTVSTPATLPARRRRDSSDDFGAGSLGSIGGSAVGSSVEDPPSHNDTKQKSPMATNKLVDTLEVVSAASKGSGSAHNSPSGKRPFKRPRKGSVDFTLSIDDDPTIGGARDDSRILPTMDALPSLDSLPLALDGSASPLLKGTASVGSSHTQGLALDHLDTLGEEAGAAASKIKIEERTRKESFGESSSNGTFATNNQRMLLGAFMSYGDHKFGARRDRFESWGGMSDLSMTGIQDYSGNSLISGGTATAAALAASALQYTSLANDVTAAALGSGANSVSSFLVGAEDSKNPYAVPSKISLNRDRLDSLASAATEPSMSLARIPTEADLGHDLQAFVKAAMASVSDQLAELASAVEAAVSADISIVEDHDPELESDMSSAASPMIGATSDNASRAGSREGRPRSLSISSAINISVDYDAVAAAVDAAEAVTGAIDLSTIGSLGLTSRNRSSSISSKTKRRQLPTQKLRSNSDALSTATPPNKPSSPLHQDGSAVPQSKLDERDMEIIRERARAAAGYIPPSSPSDLKNRPLPMKKRLKRDSDDPRTPDNKPSDMFTTPKISNIAATPATPYSAALTSQASSAKGSATKGQSSQKWDSMFDCLIEFIEERRQEECDDLPEDAKKEWAWDGNVPTTYKTKDGKALGRWVNNQRSAKSKGVLKDDREKRLVDAGLKWSVLASNSWNEMLDELRIYVNEQVTIRYCPRCKSCCLLLTILLSSVSDEGWA